MAGSVGGGGRGTMADGKPAVRSGYFVKADMVAFSRYLLGPKTIVCRVSTGVHRAEDVHVTCIKFSHNLYYNNAFALTEMDQEIE